MENQVNGAERKMRETFSLFIKHCSSCNGLGEKVNKRQKKNMKFLEAKQVMHNEQKN